jgi:hypothetical protein
MRVLPITPENPFIRAFRRGQLNNLAQLTMAHLAAFVRLPHTVTLVDEHAQRVDLDAAVDLVGITCNTPNASHVYRMADAFRARGRIVVLGGPHPTPCYPQSHRRASCNFSLVEDEKRLIGALSRFSKLRFPTLRATISGVTARRGGE